MKLKVGDTVCLNHGKGTTAKVAAILSEVKREVRLDRRLAGFYNWNEQDLLLIEEGPRPGSSTGD